MVTKKVIIQYLNASQNTTMTSSSIATHFHVTQRTIQNYLKDIRKEYPNCFKPNGKGFQVIQPLELKETSSIPSTYQERKSYILRNLLVNTCSYDLDELADELCISEVTLLNEIKRIRRALEPYDLYLKTKNNRLSITGAIEDKKALMIQLIYGEAENSLVSLTTLNEIFQAYDAETVRDILIQNLNEGHFFMDEYSLINLLLHILIAMDQQQSLATHTTQSNSLQPFNELNRHFVSIIDHVCDALENLYQVTFTQSNRYQFTLLLMTRAIRNKEIDEIDRSTISVSEDVLSLVHQIIEQVHQVYDIDLQTNEFIIAFSLHIKNMLTRLRENISIHNPLLYSIKSTSPLIYDIAVYISNIIAHAQQVDVYDDEIAYIALHIGARIEELNGRKDKLKAILVCPQYYSYYNQQFKKMETYFHDDLMITSIVTNPIDLENATCDIILSTIPITVHHISVLISNFFTEQDKEHIAQMIKQQKRSKAKQEIIEQLKHLVDPSLFRLHATYKDKEDAIQSIGNMMIDHGYVNRQFINKVFDREAISTTNFGMIAIPHPIDYYANQTIIAISILKNPIVWGNTTIKIIFMFCMNKRDFAHFSNVFTFLAGTCSEDENLEKLYNAISYEDFIARMMELYK